MDKNPEPAPAAAPVAPATLTPDMIALIGAAVGAAVKETQASAAEVNADALKRALKPENTAAPMISVFNPAGDRDNPRPKLKALVTLFDGIPIDGTTDTVEEIELYNQLEAGEYFVTRSDGTRMPFTVREIRNDLQQLQRINIQFPYRDEADRAGVLPMIVWLRDVVAQIAQRKASAAA